MTPTNYMRWHQFHDGDEWHAYSVPCMPELRFSMVLQQWWHINGESPPSSNGEWRDIGYVEGK